jgi:hypothetical protein
VDDVPEYIVHWDSFIQCVHIPLFRNIFKFTYLHDFQTGSKV